MRFFNTTALKFIFGFAGILAVSFLFLVFAGALESDKAASTINTSAVPSQAGE